MVRSELHSKVRSWLPLSEMTRVHRIAISSDLKAELRSY